MAAYKKTVYDRYYFCLDMQENSTWRGFAGTDAVLTPPNYLRWAKVSSYKARKHRLRACNSTLRGCLASNRHVSRAANSRSFPMAQFIRHGKGRYLMPFLI